MVQTHQEFLDSQHLRWALGFLLVQGCHEDQEHPQNPEGLSVQEGLSDLESPKKSRERG